MRAEITSLWQTDEVRSRRPTVYDEVKMGLDYYDVSIFATLPRLYREISEALRAAYGLEIETHELPQVLRFGSWIGGDRDGNPFVTPEVTRDAIQLARGHLLLYYQAQLDDIIDLLTTSAQQRPVSEELLKRLDAYVALVHTPEAQVFGAQYEFEYYRRFVICVKARMQRTLEQTGRHWRDAAGDAVHAGAGAGQSWRRCCRITAMSRNFSTIWRRCGIRLRANAGCALRGR